ncbi:MAG: FHA domain-containing protein [Candidatus Woesearchaeota archaeon]
MFSRKIKLTLHTNNLSGEVEEKKQPYDINRVISIGRDNNNDIHISNKLMSRYHGAIYHINKTLYFEDFNSNGTLNPEMKQSITGEGN